MRRVFNFSGGRSSAMETILEKPSGNDLVIFCDTGREVKATYDFINAFELNENIEVIRLGYTNKNAPGKAGFDALLANRKSVPNVFKRECTKVLKAQLARRFLVKNGIKSYENHIGFRYDEPERVIRYKERYEGVKTVFGLYERKIINDDVDSFWDAKEYNLTVPDILKNCDLCFLKGKANIIRILQVHPEMALPWIDDENRTGHTFIKGCSYSQLLEIAKNQTTLFDLKTLEFAFKCSCSC